MQLTPLTIATLLTTAGAVAIYKPAAGDRVDVSKDWQVCYNAVNTDPQQFCLYLTNFVEYLPQILDLLNHQPVQRGAGCVTIPGKCYPGLRTTSPYRVRAAECADPNTIYAESGDIWPSQSKCPATTLTRVVRE